MCLGGRIQERQMSSFRRLGPTAPHRTLSHFTPRHLTSPPFTAFHSTAPQFTALDLTSLRFTALYRASHHFTSLYIPSRRFTALHHKSRHFTALHLAHGSMGEHPIHEHPPASCALHPSRASCQGPPRVSSWPSRLLKGALFRHTLHALRGPWVPRSSQLTPNRPQEKPKPAQGGQSRLQDGLADAPREARNLQRLAPALQNGHQTPRGTPRRPPDSPGEAKMASRGSLQRLVPTLVEAAPPDTHRLRDLRACFPLGARRDSCSAGSIRRAPCGPSPC